MENFVQLLADLFEDTDQNVFTSQTRFKELEEWSSLIALSIILMADEEYGVTLEAKDIKEVDTIEELFQVVNAKL